MHLLADITPHPDRQSIFEQPLSDAFHLGARHIQIDNRRSSGDVLQVVDGVGAVVFVAGVVDDADVGFPVDFDEFGSKFLRRDHAPSVELTVLVLPLPIELLGRGSKVNTEDSPNVGEPGFLVGASLGGGAAGLEYCADF